ncbi:MAG: response regulator, partial [Cyanobacteria bacterium P01_F01_bin.3]
MSTRLAEKPAAIQTAARQNVMIVEDESIISLDIKSSLLNLGYGISGVAASGNSALMKIEDSHPDLILMDIHLKGKMTGIDIAEKVQSDFQIPVVYLTANADDATFQQAKLTSPYGYLLKPFGEKELGIAIEIALQKHQQEQIVKASEKWYATAFQSLHESVIATDEKGQIIFMNAFAESMTGWQLSSVIDQPLVEVLTFQPPARSTAVEEAQSTASILEAVLNGCSIQPIPHKTQLVTKSLTHVPIEGDAAALRETSGRIIGSIFKFREYEDRSSTATDATYVQSPNVTALSEATTLTETIATIDRSSQGLEGVVTVDSLEEYSADDVELVAAFVKSFIKMESAFFSNRNLVASSGEGVTTLSARTEGLVVKVTDIEGKSTAAVKQSSEYWSLIRQILIENHFFPVSLRTNGVCRFQLLDVPENCQLYHTHAEALCEAWYGSHHPAHTDSTT